MVAACEHQDFIFFLLLLLGDNHVQSRRGRRPCVLKASVSARTDVSCDPQNVGVPTQGSAAARLPPAPAAFQELHLLRTIRVTSQNSNLPAACHFKTGSVKGIAGALVRLDV